MLKISGTTITLTRGDSANILLDLQYKNSGESYVPEEGDSIRFAMKKTYSDLLPSLVLVNIPIDSLILHISPEDTKYLAYGDYKYDIQLTKANGDIDTFIDLATFIITEEVE